jgi:prepilin-type N-terminal cleavage/methylation domain-containing protein
MRKLSGFTMIELIVTLAVSAILMAIAVPSMSTLMSSNRRVAQTNNLVLALQYAKSEAIKQDTLTGVSVTSSGSWAQGWSVCCAANSTTVLDTLPPVNSATTVIASSPAGNPATIAFDSNGAILNGTGTVVFTFCDQRGASQASSVEVDMVGRVQTSSVPGFQVNQTTALVCP